jgi:tetratricopeptide (TPR) repeat protein
LGVPVEQDQQALVARVITALCAREPYLVVFDNAESAEALREYVRQLHGNGNVLITSRSERWSSVAEAVSVTQWDEEESVRFLLERTGQTDSEAARALARDLDGLVLALEHAAAFARAGDGIPLAEYHRIWREKLSRTPRGHEYPRSVAAALGLSMDRVKRESGLAYELLSLFAWLAPDRIPKKELLEAGAGKLPEALRKALSDRDAWNELIETLGRYSLVKHERREGEAGVGYFLHRVVQQVMRDRLAADGESERWLAAACDVVDEAFPFDADEPDFWPLSAMLLPHVRAIRVHAGGEAAPASLGRLLNQAGGYLRVRGLYSEARDFSELALESGLRQFGPNHPNVAVYRSNLAAILSDLGERQQARKQIELALDSDLRQFGPDHPNVAVRRNNLATILGALGERQEALREIERALDILRRTLPPGHPHIRTAEASREAMARSAGG